MGLFDKFNKDDLLSKAKNIAGAATETVKSTINTTKETIEQKKTEKAAYEAEMDAKAAELAKEIVESIMAYQNNGGVFENIQPSQLLSFTKDFYDKILMPANSVSKSRVTMHPYIEQKALEKLAKDLSDYDSSETPILVIKEQNKQIILITDKTLYFKLPVEGETKFFAKGKVPCSEISKFSVEIGESKALFKCDEYILTEFAADKVVKEDFITLDNYFKSIESKDFVITDEEVDKLIREKIGSKIISEIQKYMIYDDEQLVYFAWGVDSLSAKDYIVCTNKQIITVDRELFGATANIKQFYYEDVTSASIEQNSNNSDLTGYLLETALTAATKTCDLVISVAGAKTVINTLFKVEAERVVAVYHQFRKSIKSASAQPQVVVQQTSVDPIEQIQKLKGMLDMGIITEEEFNAKKADLLAKL